MKSGLEFHGLIRCDQPGCDYVMEFTRIYTGRVLDQICIRIDQLDYHRSDAHPEVYAAEVAEEEASRA